MNSSRINGENLIACSGPPGDFTGVSTPAPANSGVDKSYSVVFFNILRRSIRGKIPLPSVGVRLVVVREVMLQHHKLAVTRFFFRPAR